MAKVEMDPELLRRAHANVLKAVERVRLLFGQFARKGVSGQWLAHGTGNSIEFRDHRQYFPGDDPRYIDWRAYARSDQYVMKLFQEEITPRIDLIFDASRSMLYREEKGLRAIELLYFVLESAKRAGATVQPLFVSGSVAQSTEPERVSNYDLPRLPSGDSIMPIVSAPLRQGSVRICITDLMFPGEPSAFFEPLVRHGGRLVLFVPTLGDEAEPDWSENVRLVDVETGTARELLVTDELRERYRMAYREHFDLWQRAAARFGAVLVRVPCESEFVESLRYEAFPLGMVRA